MTSNSLTLNEEHHIHPQILKIVLDYVPQLFLYSNMCGFLFICTLASSHTLVVNKQNLLFILFH